MIFCSIAFVSVVDWCCFSAVLFSWVLQRDVSVDQAMRCAKREPGRSWEALEGELHKLGMIYLLLLCVCESHALVSNAMMRQN